MKAEDKQALIELCEAISAWREKYGDFANFMLPAIEAQEIAKIALAALTAQPVDWQQRAEAAEMALNTVRAQRDLEIERNNKAEEEKAKLHAEIYRLKDEVKGPDGFETWKDAAISLKLAAKNKDKNIDYLTAMAAFHSSEWHKMGPITGYMKGWNARPAPAVSLAELMPGGWIKCSDQMPEKDVEVQVYCADKKEQMVGYLEENEEEGYFRFATWKNGKGIYCQPTHWKPLAAAPEVD